MSEIGRFSPDSDELFLIKNKLEEKIKAEEKLKHDLSVVKSMLNNCDEATYLIDKDFILLGYNESASQLTKKHKGKELIQGSSLLDYLNEDEWTSLFNNARKCILGDIIQNEYQLTENLWVKCTFKPIYKFDSSFMGICLTLTDISKIKKAEIEAKYNEDLYREIVENAPDAIVIFDFETLQFVDCNENALKMFHISSKEELLKLGLPNITPEFQPDGSPSHIKASIYGKMAFLGERPSFEWMHIDVEGNEIFCEVRLSRLFWKEKILGRSSMVDISERKKAENLLIESEQRYKSLFQRNPDGVFSLDNKGLFITANDAFSELNEIPLDELINTSFVRVIAPEDLDTTMGFFFRCWEGISDTFEVDIITGKGNRKSISVTSIPVMSGEQVIEVYGTAKDITQAKKHTTEILKASQQLRNIYESISDAFISLDTNWNIIMVNSQYERIMGMDRSMLLGKNYFELKKNSLTDEFISYLQKAVEDQKPYNFEYFSDPFWFGIALYPSVDGLSIYIRDITEKKLAEKKLQNSLYEKETLLAEIHHRVKNNLAVVSSILQLQSYSVNDEKVKEALQDSRNRIQSIALVHQKLYMSESLSRIPMQGYITDLVNRLKETYLSQKLINIQIHAEEIELDIIKAIPCGLILNELITNIYKHAFNDRESGKIEVKFVRQQEIYELEIYDNGVGLPDTINLETPATMGMQLIQMLTEQLNGVIKIMNDEGTRVCIRFKSLT